MILVTLAVALLLSASGCGGSKSPVVVHVGSRAITQATVAHWTHIVAIKDYELKPTKPVPAGVVPDPPDYTQCIARSKIPALGTTKGASGTPAQLKRKCQEQLMQLRDQAISFLINCEALLQEGAARGLKASDKEIAQRFASVKEAEFPVKGTFQRYLGFVGETMADQRFRARVKVFTKKIQAQILSAKGETQTQRYRAFAEFGNEFPVRWARKTRCAHGYVVPNCSEYRGPLTPQLVI